jgi:outer membrane protein OmpA-like peptidoglycan-associated protein
MKRCLLALFLLLAAPVHAQMQSDAIMSPFHGGVRANYLRNFHESQAQIVVDCPECGTFSNGSGSGYQFELFGEVPFNFFRRLNLTFGVGLAERGGNFGESTVGGLPVLDPNARGTADSIKYVPLVRQNNYAASLTYLTLAAGVRVQPLRGLPAYFTTGLEGGLPLGRSTTFKQTESILEPEGVLYPENNTRSLVRAEGVIENVNTVFGLRGAVGYELPLSEVITASPEISYYFPLSSVESGFPWKVSSITAGIAVRWNKPSDVIEFPSAKQEGPVVSRDDPNALAPKLSAASLSSEPFHIIETTVTETFPILPYIFFDSASSALSDRFAQLNPLEVARFKESELPHRSLESYYQLLNVIGSRLRSNPSATLAINGTTDGRESSDRESLARARAASVREYFVSVWKIAPDRLKISTSPAPQNPSSTEYAEGFEENRRVELWSDNDQILKPIVHERFREETASPKAIPIRLAATSKIGLRNWHMALRSGASTIFEKSGEGNPPAQIEWRPNEGQVESIAKTLQPSDSLVIEFDAAATNGARSIQTASIPAAKSINPFELSRLSLIVFDFDQATISKQNERMISQFVAKSLYPASTATITGSTDNLGELKHNQKLSTDRAFNVRDLVVADKSDAKITSTLGIGPSNLLYDNHLPEGRYYCRTVRVEVETPLESVVKGQ